MKRRVVSLASFITLTIGGAGAARAAPAWCKAEGADKLNVYGEVGKVHKETDAADALYTLVAAFCAPDADATGPGPRAGGDPEALVEAAAHDRGRLGRRGGLGRHPPQRPQSLDLSAREDRLVEVRPDRSVGRGPPVNDGRLESNQRSGLRGRRLWRGADRGRSPRLHHGLHPGRAAGRVGDVRRRHRPRSTRRSCRPSCAATPGARPRSGSPSASRPTRQRRSSRRTRRGSRRSWRRIPRTRGSSRWPRRRATSGAGAGRATPSSWP